MPVKEEFNRKVTFTAVNDSTLRISNNGIYDAYYDYILRIMVVVDFAIPFSQLDRETLIQFRDRLISLGGKPPELPTEAPKAKSASNSLNL